MKIVGKVEYVGTNYQGWQKQKNGSTIQNEIESVLAKILDTPISIYGSGRTDAGVHATGQRFHFEINKDNLDLNLLRHATNSLLPSDIRIISFLEVEETFDARKSAKKKIYQYKIIFGEANAFEKPYFCEIKRPISLEKFKEALNLFIGTHNFFSLTSKKEDIDNFVRTIYSIDVEMNENKAIITFVGNGFMRYMIRYIVGVALAVATAKMKIEDIELLLTSSTRHITSHKAPANGLVLVDVLY